MIQSAQRCTLALIVAACCAGCWGSGSPSASQATTAQGRSHPDVSKLRTGPELYKALCEACHGQRGAADGPGAQSLYPPARNFRTHRFRLISTASGVPTRADIDRVIALGMPGTSMRAFSELSSEQREQLVDEVLRFRRDGIEEQVRKFLRDQEEPDLDAAVAREVLSRTTPGSIVTVPKLKGGGRQAIERGKAIYFRQACQACHGPDGTGVHEGRWMTDEGIPTRGRDLVHEPFKGGHAPESIYLRLALGMPGTPMPASRTLTPVELADLVAYCTSLSREPKRELTNHQRRQLATPSAYLQAFGKSK